MTAAEMEEEFLILYDKITNFDAPGYESDEVSRFLSKAQERLVLYIVNPKGNKYITGFESTEKRRKDLSELMRDVRLLPTDLSASQVGVKPNGFFYDLPDDFLYAMQEDIDVSSQDVCVDGTNVDVKPITHNEYNKSKRNPFKRPHKFLAWRMDFSREVVGTNPKRHELITDGTYTVDSYNIRYVKRLLPIISDGSTIEGVVGPIDCELDAIMHRAIVDEAVAIASGITTPQEYQIKLNEAQSSE